MQLTREQVRHYTEHGYLVLDDCLGDGEAALLRDELDALLSQDQPGTVRERDGRTVRALHGCHLSNERFNHLTRLSRIVEPARQLLDGSVYVYQFKINVKAAFGGEAWKWHQDYVYWRNEDGMPAPAAVNVLICLDDITEFNGPLMLIAGSHRHGMLETAPPAAAPPRDGVEWLRHVSADLKYTLDPPTVKSLVAEGAIVAPKGRRGMVLLFHPNVAHASGPNLSPFDRAVVIVTYNSITNVPTRLSRPEFLVSRSREPVTPIGDVLV